MQVELWTIGRVKPNENNPKFNDDAVEALVASIREFGFRQPIVVDSEGVIVCRHTRYEAAHRLGVDKVPVHVANDLTPEQISAYRVADNRVGSNLGQGASWRSNSAIRCRCATCAGT